MGAEMFPLGDAEHATMATEEQDISEIFERLRKCELYINAHEAKIEERWRTQFRDNQVFHDRITACKEAHQMVVERIESLERKVARWSGAAAFAGALLASVINWFFST